MSVEGENLAGLVAAAHRIGITITPRQQEAFLGYADLLLFWNDRINLLGPAAVQQLWSRHMLDALTLWRSVPDTLRAADAMLSLIDVGSGAGFPGVPLQIAFPSWQVTVLEATGKRVRFLEEVQRELALSQLLVVAGRAEDVAHDRDFREAYDLSTARAVTHLAGLVELTIPFVTVDGATILFKTLAGLSDEVAAAEPARVALGAAAPEVLPIGSGEEGRCLVRYRKVSRTPASLPRKAGTPEHRPLTRHDAERIGAAELEARAARAQARSRPRRRR